MVSVHGFFSEGRKSIEVCFLHFYQFWEDKIEESNGKPFKSEIQTKFTHLTLDVIGLCAFGYSFDGIKKGNTEESQATNTILTANFNMLRRTLEFMFPFLEYIPSKERDGLKRAEKVLYGLMEQVRLILMFLLYYSLPRSFSNVNRLPNSTNCNTTSAVW